MHGINPNKVSFQIITFADLNQYPESIMRIGSLVLFSIFLFNVSKAQTREDSVKIFVKKLYFTNQRAIDRSTSGIGIDRSTIVFGDNYQPVVFNKVDVRAKMFEFKLGIANCDYRSPVTQKNHNTEVTSLSFGVNYPFSKIGIGRANSTKGIRAVPFFSADFGRSTFKNVAMNSKPASTFHLSLSPGFRIKIPYLIIDFRLNSTWNCLKQTNYDENLVSITSNGDLIKENSFKSLNFTPSVSVILDGLFSVFKPKNSRVSGEMAVIDNVTTKKYYSGETRNSVTGKMELDGLYKTETTYEYHQESISLPVSDIGTFVGIGPRLVFRPVSKSSYRMPTLMGGAGVHARRKLFCFDLNVDKGTIGYSSQVQTDRDIIKTDTLGKGSFNVTNVTSNIGVDIGPFLLGLLGMVTQRNGETPYFSISAGFIYGYSFLKNYTYHDASVGQAYQTYFAANPTESSIYTNAALNKSGIIRGLYMGAEVGAVSFRYEFTTYKKAPLAKCGYLSISYKYPLLRSLRKLKAKE